MMGEIPLTQGRVALIDPEDYDFLMQWKWCCITGYAARSTSGVDGAKRRTVLMHRVIANPPEGFFVDHINHDRLDNRRVNLRICTPGQNTFNRRPRPRQAERSSRFKGVYWNKTKGKWEVQITLKAATGENRKMIGRFVREIDAALAYDAAALHYFGEFAYLNFPAALPRRR
jgi:hypothetical protein